MATVERCFCSRLPRQAFGNYSCGSLAHPIVVDPERPGTQEDALTDAECLLIFDGLMTLLLHPMIDLLKEYEQELQKTIEEADALAKKRHDAIHCGWSVDQTGNVGGTRKGSSLDMTIDDLNDLAERSHRLAAKIAKFSQMDLVKEGDGVMTVYSSAAAFKP